MNAFTYYSPILLGVVLVFILHDTLAELVPAQPPGLHWTAYSLLALGGGLIAQLFMIGLQGAFAQVVPVPIGKTIRGRGAVFVGLGILLSMIALTLAGLLHAQAYVAAAEISLYTAIGVAAVALVIYAWSWPAARPDFS